MYSFIIIMEREILINQRIVYSMQIRILTQARSCLVTSSGSKTSWCQISSIKQTTEAKRPQHQPSNTRHQA